MWGLRTSFKFKGVRLISKLLRIIVIHYIVNPQEAFGFDSLIKANKVYFMELRIVEGSVSVVKPDEYCSIIKECFKGIGYVVVADVLEISTAEVIMMSSEYVGGGLRIDLQCVNEGLGGV
ncbi:MAG: hypothetical protein QXP80_05305 [Zestosphaera sp.]